VSDVTFATIDQLLKKPQRVKTIPVAIQTDDGGIVEVAMRVRAIGSSEYDALLAEYPPTAKQKKDDPNTPYNPETFPPALIAACAAEPTMTVEQAEEIWKSEHWSRGELTTLFFGCMEVNARGLDVPFSETDSATTRRSR
jgi:hypothetical protein